MGQADDDTRSNEVEFLDIGPTGGAVDEVPLVRRWLRWPPFVLLAAVLAAVVITLVVRGNSKFSAAPTTHGPTAARPSFSAPSMSPTQASVPPVTITEVGHPLLGATGGWELLGRGDGVVVRIQLSLGRITRTSVPALLSTGPVSFIARDGWALVRPLDFVAGYLLSDGKPASVLSGVLSQTGPAFPGPDPVHVWVPTNGSGPDRMILAGPDGRSTGVTIPVPAGTSPLNASPDGTGYLLFLGLGGVYDARPDRTRRVTTGAVLAVGPTRWLTAECDDQDHCASVVIDRASGARRVLNTPVGDVNVQPGVISPDGTSAARMVRFPSSAVEIIDLTTGTEHALALRIDQSAVDDGQSLAWSPDSRWLFATDANGHLNAVDAHTGHITDFADLGTSLPNLSQLALRSGRSN